LDLRYNIEVVHRPVPVLICDVTSTPERGEVDAKIAKKVSPNNVQDNLRNIDKDHRDNSEVLPGLIG
jgi:hypothetical protein